MNAPVPALFECVPNVSDGRDAALLDACATAIASEGVHLAHRTHDALHHRSVFTFFGTRDTVLAAALALARVTTEGIDLRVHRGAHPRMGALDVLPFVPFGGATLEDAAALAREAATRLWSDYRLPSFFYGEASMSRRLLGDVRSGEFEGLTARSAEPDVGRALHTSAGAVAVGARGPLVAFNIVLAGGDLATARQIARTVRERSGGLVTLRALGIALAGGRVQISCNVTDAAAVPLHRLTGVVRSLAQRAGLAVERTELIGLVPRAALAAVAAHALGIEALPGGAQ